MLSYQIISTQFLSDTLGSYEDPAESITAIGAGEGGASQNYETLKDTLQKDQFLHILWPVIERVQEWWSCSQVAA